MSSMTTHQRDDEAQSVRGAYERRLREAYERTRQGDDRRRPTRSGYERSSERDPNRGIDTQRGRYALGWLIEQNGIADLRTWAEHVAAWEEDVPLVQVSRNKRSHIYSWLYFAFVPRLVQEGILEYEDDLVRPVDDVKQLGKYLGKLATGGDS